ncbi:MAG: hypothetical protein JW947_11200 [Sedimentisphaerales bacterium]|nr:hypothetical protein [Sedimentisphaerales bacterium]
MAKDKQKQSLTKKDTGENDFFGIDEQRLSTHWGWHVLAVTVCVIFTIWVWLLNPGNNLNPDQLNIVVMQLAKEYPENFARDPILSGNAADFYPYLYRIFISKVTEKFGITGGHLILQFPLTLTYLVVMYYVLYTLTRSVPAALLISLFSCLWRYSMGASYWGMDRLQAVQPRSFVLILIPLLLLMAWRYRQSWLFLVVFGVLGLLVNISPPSALFFAMPLWFATLDERRPTKQKQLLLAGAVVVMIICAWPFIYSHITTRTETEALSAEERGMFVEAMKLRFSRMSSFPEPLKNIGKVILSFSPVLLLAIAGWALRGRNRGPFDRWLLSFFLFTMICFVALQYIMQKASTLLEAAPPIANIHRGQRFAYLPLYIYSAVLLKYLFDQIGRLERYILTATAGVLVALIPLIEFSGEKGKISQRWETNVNNLGMLIQGEKIEALGWHNNIVPVAEWAKENTPPDSLFLIGHPNVSSFRIYALRSIAGALTDGGIAFYNGPKKMIQWYKIEDALEQFLVSRDAKNIIKLIEETHPDYILIPTSIKVKLTLEEVYKDDFCIVYKYPKAAE